MRAPRLVTPVRWPSSARPVAFLTAMAVAVATSGCLSNEYRIKKDELQRLAMVAPEARGVGVRMSQTLGDRRSDEIDPEIPEATPADGDGGGSVDVNVGGGGGSRATTPMHAAGARGFGGGANGTWRGTPPAPAGGTTGPGGFHGTPIAGALHAGGGGYHVPSMGGGGGGLNLSGGSGGNDLGAALVIIAVVAVVAATVATISLAAGEGTRFEGHAEMSPAQLVYLKNDVGERAVALADLTPADAASSDYALVKDDEGYGLRRLDRAPLDRKGGVFRFDLGAGVFTFGDARASGLSAHVQGGFFFTSKVGLLLDLGLGAGGVDPCCVGALAPGGTLTRHSLGLELDALPLALGPVHLGGFAGGGLALASAGGDLETGPLANLGALIELDLTSHMALALRGSASRAWLPSGASSAGAITGGLTIY
jgi:hypothetical protein